MNEVRQSLNERFTQAQSQLELISLMELGKIKVDSEKGKKLVSPQKIAVAKASVIVMVYNFAESCIRQTIDEINEEISTNRTSYLEASEKIKKLWSIIEAKRIRLAKDETIANLLRETVSNAKSRSSINLSWKKIEKVIDGNVGPDQIREIANIFGIDFNCRKMAKGGGDLQTVKDKRNDLGHGIYSFEEVGRDYSMVDIRRMMITTKFFLYEFIKSTEYYIDNSQYKSQGQAN